MTDLKTVLESECAGMTHKEAIEHVIAKTITVDGLAPAGYGLTYLASIGKMKTIRTIASTDTHPLQDAADAILVTLEGRDGFDFSNPMALNMLAAFVTGSVITQAQSNAIRELGQKQALKFPRITIRDVITIRNPSDIVTSYSNIEDNKGVNRFHDLELTVSGDVPTDTYANVMVRHSPAGIWKRIDSIPAINLADVYYRRIPGEFIKEFTEIRCQCQYNITMSLTARTV